MSKKEKAVKIIERLREERDLMKQKFADVCAESDIIKQDRDAWKSKCALLEGDSATKDSKIASLEAEVTQLRLKLDQISLTTPSIKPCDICAAMRDQFKSMTVETQAFLDLISLMEIRLEIAHKKSDQQVAPLPREKSSSFFDSQDSSDDETEPSRAVLAYKPTETERQVTTERDIWVDFDTIEEPFAQFSPTCETVVPPAQVAHVAQVTPVVPIASATKLYVGLGGRESYIYEEAVQQIIATKLGQGEFVFDVMIDGESHFFDFVEMVQTAQERKYAIREFDEKSRAAFVLLDSGMMPYEKSISDQICAAIDQEVTIKLRIDGKDYIIDGARKTQMHETTGFSRRIQILSMENHFF
jgi:hypothetical protein